MSTADIGVGIVGAGFIAGAHAAALAATGGARLAAVADQDLARARGLAVPAGARAVGSLDELLASDDVAAVVLCTPNDTHVPMGRAVLESGRHLLLEKPLAITVAGARELVDVAARAGRALVVGHTHRHTDLGRAVRSAVDDDVAGAPRMIRIAITGGWIWGGWQSWVLDPARSGGHALHNGVHLLDLAAWWGGAPIDRVRALGQHATSAAMALYDYLVIDGELANGVQFVCEISRAERPRTAALFEVEVVGTAGVIHRSWDADGIVAVTESGTSAPAPARAGEAGFARQMRSFVDAARGGVVVPPVEDAVSAVTAACAAERSLELGRPCTLQEVS